MSEPDTTAGPEEEQLLDRLCNDPLRVLRHFHVTPNPDGPRPTREQLCGEINRALDAYERGECKALDSADGRVPLPKHGREI